MNEIKSHRDLEAWQVSMEMVMRTYALCKTFPREEIHGLAGQMRRAAVSVPSNIAEGQARGPGKAALNYLAIALGSLAELVHGLRRAKRRRLVTSAAVAIAAISLIVHFVV